MIQKKRLSLSVFCLLALFATSCTESTTAQEITTEEATAQEVLASQETHDEEDAAASEEASAATDNVVPFAEEYSLNFITAEDINQLTIPYDIAFTTNGIAEERPGVEKEDGVAEYSLDMLMSFPAEETGYTTYAVTYTCVVTPTFTYETAEMSSAGSFSYTVEGFDFADYYTGTVLKTPSIVPDPDEMSVTVEYSYEIEWDGVTYPLAFAVVRSDYSRYSYEFIDETVCVLSWYSLMNLTFFVTVPNEYDGLMLCINTDRVLGENASFFTSADQAEEAEEAEEEVEDTTYLLTDGYSEEKLGDSVVFFHLSSQLDS